MSAGVGSLLDQQGLLECWRPTTRGTACCDGRCVGCALCWLVGRTGQCNCDGGVASRPLSRTWTKPSRSWKHGLHTDHSLKSFLHRLSSEHTPSTAVVAHSDVLGPSVLRFLLSCMHKWQGSVFFFRPPAAVAIVNCTRAVGVASCSKHLLDTHLINASLCTHCSIVNS